MAITVSPLPSDDPEETERHPIGLPSGFTVERPNRVGMTADALSRTTVSPPRYWTGDEWSLVSSLPPEDRGALQLLMRQIGLISPTARLVGGSWDATSASAFKEVLTWANVNDVPWQSALEQMATSSAQFGSINEGETRAPLVARVSDPDEIKAGLRDMFRDRLGAGDAVDEARLDAMVKAWQGEEISAQQTEFNAAETGGVVTAPPDFKTWAEEQAKIAAPVAYDSNKVVDRFSRIGDLLRGAE